MGRLQTFVNRNGDTQTFTYDAFNRLSYFTWNDGLTPRVDFGYDAASRLTSVTNVNATISRAYFNDNLLQTETETPGGGVARAVHHIYDADGNLALYKSQDIYSTTITLDVTSCWISSRAALHWPAMFMMRMATRATLPRGLANNTSTTYQYDLLDRVTNVTHSLSIRDTRTLDYGYDSVGNRKWIKRDGGTGDVFRYDQADQANAVKLNIVHPDTTPSPAPSIVYDANGNFTTFSPYGTTDTYTTNYLNHTPNATGSMLISTKTPHSSKASMVPSINTMHRTGCSPRRV